MSRMDDPITFSKDALVIALEQERKKVASLEATKSAYREEVWADFLSMRGVKTPCTRCNGLGVRVYGSTATWHGGIGGAAMTSGICDGCWGSGDKNRPWLNLKTLPRT